MRTRLPWCWTAVTAVIALSALVSADTQRSLPGYRLIDVLVFEADLEIDLTPYPGGRTSADRGARRRFDAYESKRSKPTGDSELEMVFAAQVRYERRLVAISTSPAVDALAMAYVTDLGPCYEWEGGSDCPEREAVFAARYQDSHPSSPFSQYLPLLEAHRWLCAAEGYESERVPAEAERSRRWYRRPSRLPDSPHRCLCGRRPRNSAREPDAIGKRWKRYFNGRRRIAGQPTKQATSGGQGYF